MFVCFGVAIAAQQAPVWEITGAEFSKSEMHTADGISIRFPRMTRIRDDKDWKSATNLPQLKVRRLLLAGGASSSYPDALLTRILLPSPARSCIASPRRTAISK